jgi:hypothetical protein
MLSIGIVVGLTGYGLVFWGAQMFNGCTANSFLNIMWPGGQKFKPCKGAVSGPNGPTNSTNANKNARQANGLPSGTQREPNGSLANGSGMG